MDVRTGGKLVEDVQDDTFRSDGEQDYSRKKHVSKFGIFMNDLESQPRQRDQRGLQNDDDMDGYQDRLDDAEL